MQDELLIAIKECFKKERLKRSMPDKPDKTLSQNEVARQIGVESSTICRIENLNYKCNLEEDTFFALCKLYDISEEQILKFYRIAIGKSESNTKSELEILRTQITQLQQKNAILEERLKEMQATNKETIKRLNLVISDIQKNI